MERFAILIQGGFNLTIVEKVQRIIHQEGGFLGAFFQRHLHQFQIAFNLITFLFDFWVVAIVDQISLAQAGVHFPLGLKYLYSGKCLLMHATDKVDSRCITEKARYMTKAIACRLLGPLLIFRHAYQGDAVPDYIDT